MCVCVCVAKRRWKILFHSVNAFFAVSLSLYLFLHEGTPAVAIMAFVQLIIGVGSRQMRQFIRVIMCKFGLWGRYTPRMEITIAMCAVYLLISHAFTLRAERYVNNIVVVGRDVRTNVLWPTRNSARLDFGRWLASTYGIWTRARLHLLPCFDNNNKMDRNCFQHSPTTTDDGFINTFRYAFRRSDVDGTLSLCVWWR